MRTNAWRVVAALVLLGLLVGAVAVLPHVQAQSPVGDLLCREMAVLQEARRGYGDPKGLIGEAMALQAEAMRQLGIGCVTPGR